MKILKMSVTICLFVLLQISCEKEDIIDDNQSSSSISNRSVNATYAVTPVVGQFTALSTSAVTLSASSGNYAGGIIRAKVLSNTGSQYVVQISKQNGTAFSVAGVAKLKMGSVGGTTSGSANYAIGATTVNVTISATFAQGVAHFYPVLESTTGGTKYYAEPLMVYTLPSYKPAPYVFGNQLCTVDGVIVYANDTDLADGNNQYQCVEFYKRYYLQNYGMSLGSNGHAFQLFTSNVALTKYANGGTKAPRVGDVFCLKGSGTSNPFGHVAIITEVSSNQVKMANQNGGTGLLYPVGWTLSRTGNTVSSPSGFIVQGWMRKP